jgi:uncharacterized protein
MNPAIEKLLILHDRDLRLARLSEELKRIPLEQLDLDRQLKTATDDLEAARSGVKRIEADRKRLELEVQAKEATVAKYKNKLLEIKNNDQFHALQHEIDAAEGEIRKIEDQELELMEKQEQAQTTLKYAESRFNEVKTTIEKKRGELNQRAEILQKQQSEVQGQRSTLVNEVNDEGILARYEKIFQSKGEAVVRVSHGMCSGCHLKLTPQETHNAKHSAGMVTCTNCGRILYWIPE